MRFILLFLILPFILFADTTKLEKVSLQQAWKNQFQFAGYYVAKEKGFYKELGIDLDIKEFKAGISISDDVLSRKSDFGIGRSSLVIDKVKKKKDILFLAALYQHSPLVMISLKRDDIVKINDIKGKRFTPNMNKELMASINAMLISSGIKKSDYKTIDSSFDYTKLIRDETDMVTGYISNEPFRLKEKGFETRTFHPKDYGFDFYGDILFTSKEFENKNPELVKNFYAASMKGWRYAFDNIEQSVEIILQKYNSQNKSKEALIYEANALKKLAIVDGIALGNIDKNKLQNIYNSYALLGMVKGKSVSFESCIFKYKKDILYLSKKENDYLKSKKEIKICIDPNWMPFEKFDKDGNHIGISSDYFKIFQKQLTIPITPIKTKSWDQTLEFAKNRKCDILTLGNETAKRKEYLNFTSPYLKIPFVMVTKNDVPYFDNFKFLKDEKIGVVKNSSLLETLKIKYPNLNIVKVKSDKEGLKKVQNNELFAHIGNMLSIGYIIKKDFIQELKIINRLEDKTSNLAMGIRNDDEILYSIFQKLISKIDDDTKEQILNKYMSVKFEKAADYKYLKIVLIVVFIFSVIFLAIHLKLKQLNRKLELEVAKKTKDLQNLNKTLEQKVFDQTKELQYKNQILEEAQGIAKLGSWVLNFEDNKLNWSDEVYNIFELEKDNCEISYELFLEKIHPDDRKLVDQTYNKSIEKKTSYSIQHRLQMDDGRVKWVQEKCETQFDENGNPIISTGTIQDITKQYESDRILEEQSKLAAMGKMIGNIAHQWRQPLSVISTGATGLKIHKEYGTLNDELFMKTCVAINDNAQYLSKTIDDFRNFIKGDREKHYFNLDSNINSFVNLIEGTIKANEINLIRDIDKDINIIGYPNELIQCLINIVNNAKDKLQELEQEKCIFISAYSNEEIVVITIKDNAGGIPDDVLPHIFEPYFTTKHQAQGTGLGLSMTYNLIVEGMHGTIEANNTKYEYEGKEYLGAKFTITLPVS